MAFIFSCCLSWCNPDSVPLEDNISFHSDYLGLDGGGEEQDTIKIDSVGNGKYEIGRKLGSGSFGAVFSCKCKDSGKDFAVKVERSSTKVPMLDTEFKLLQQLQGGAGIPTAHLFGTEEPYNFLVMDLQGRSLEVLFSACKRKFSMKTILLLGEQMIERCEYMHSKRVVHRDLKPSNFLMGIGNKAAEVQVVDFGLSMYYMDSKKNHVPYVQNKSLAGTAHYASINTHAGMQQSRRDDLEAVGYMLVYFRRGKLPWQGLKVKDPDYKATRIFEEKKRIPLEDLCKNCPPEFLEFLRYVRGMRFPDTPEYERFRKSFRDKFVRDGYKDDKRFEWSDAAE
jgi:casein kinase 1